LREAIAAWLTRRHGLASLDAATQVLPVLGSREALFAFTQTLIDASRVGATGVVPNPFYQIYEGAALLAGATPYCINGLAMDGNAPSWDEVPDGVWARTQLLFVCSPDNPTGRVATMDDWRRIFALSDRYGFVIAADACYSEVYSTGQTAAWSAGRRKWLGLGLFAACFVWQPVPFERSRPALRLPWLRCGW
jgi:N-succinyldiaminopimelate aminotransferase